MQNVMLFPEPFYHIISETQTYSARVKGETSLPPVWVWYT